jgi:hypothetical protein
MNLLQPAGRLKGELDRGIEEQVDGHCCIWPEVLPADSNVEPLPDT